MASPLQEPIPPGSRKVSSLVLGSDFFGARAVLDLVLQKDQRLLVVEVKGRTARRHDRVGLDAFHSRKRRRLARAINCWRSDHPDADHQLLQVVLALVNLSGSATSVRWLAIHQLS